jgi:hypothetical protein
MNFVHILDFTIFSSPTQNWVPTFLFEFLKARPKLGGLPLRFVQGWGGEARAQERFCFYIFEKMNQEKLFSNRDQQLERELVTFQTA